MKRYFVVVFLVCWPLVGVVAQVRDEGGVPEGRYEALERKLDHLRTRQDDLLDVVDKRFDDRVSLLRQENERLKDELRQEVSWITKIASVVGGMGLVGLAGFALWGWRQIVGLRDRVRKEIDNALDEELKNPRDELKRLIREQERDGRIKRRSKVLVLYGREPSGVREELARFGFDFSNIVERRIDDAPPPEGFNVVVFDHISDDQINAYRKDFPDTPFLIYLADGSRSNVQGGQFANSVFTLYARLMEMAVYYDW